MTIYEVAALMASCGLVSAVAAIWIEKNRSKMHGTRDSIKDGAQIALDAVSALQFMNEELKERVSELSKEIEGLKSENVQLHQLVLRLSQEKNSE